MWWKKKNKFTRLYAREIVDKNNRGDTMSKRLEYNRKYQEYDMKITKMAGYLSDYYIDRAIESDDYALISSFLIDYFCGSKRFDVGYLVSKYKEFGLNEKIEDMDFDINEWYQVKYEIDNPSVVDEQDQDHVIKMDQDEYIQYMINKRKKEIEE